LLTHPEVRSVLDRAEGELISAGWLLGPAQRRNVRLGALFMFAVLALGILRAAAGSANGRPIGYLVLVMIPVAIAALLLLRAPYRTGGAQALLARMRNSSGHLRPNQSPSWSTYGPAGAALGVGLFGAMALWAADPAFANAAEIQRQQAAASSSGGGSGC